MRDVLLHFQGRIADIASFFGKDRRQSYRWIGRSGLPVEDFRA